MNFSYKENIEIFKDTQQLSNSVYTVDTRRAIRETKVFEEIPKALGYVKYSPDIKFVRMGTIEAAINFSDLGERLAILNFADALTPGGLVLDGENTQEECICRCTNLYECLLKQECEEHYYKYNMPYANIYSDRIIYSPEVKIFKDDKDYNRLDKDIKVDVITCPSPACKVPVHRIVSRISTFLGIARFYAVDTLILGAWGCGAFGQDPLNMGSCFAISLLRNSYFKNIIFALRSSDTTYNKFKEGFDKVVNNIKMR